jgi:hypothetical protein
VTTLISGEGRSLTEVSFPSATANSRF